MSSRSPSGSPPWWRINRLPTGLSDEARIMDPSGTLPNTPPPVADARLATGTDRFDSFFTKFEEIITTKKTQGESSLKSNKENQIGDRTLGSPSFQEVEAAKKSLMECLSDLFKLNMRDRLAAALLTLTRAEFGLSADQQRSIRVFWDNFDGFISDFLVFEQDNSEYELQKLARDRILQVMKQNHETHLSNKQLLEALTEEEEELTKRLEEVKTRKQRLISDWESLIIESERMSAEYAAQEKKLTVAEEKKRIAEEMMSRSTAAWSSLKAHFLTSPVEIEEQKQYPNVSSSLCQRPLVGSEKGTKHPNAPPYEEYIRNRQIVRFRSLEKPKRDNFTLELSKLHSYDEPKPEPIRYRSVRTLEDMLIIHNQVVIHKVCVGVGSKTCCTTHSAELKKRRQVGPFDCCLLN